MALRLYNSLSRHLEDFEPLSKDVVTFYSCGPTIYNFAHIGNFRAFVFADTVKRVLTYLGYNVRHIMNLTDVEDKIIREHQATGKSLKELTEPFGEAFKEDSTSLNIIPPEKYTKATAYIDDMVHIIEELLNKGFAYKGEDGSVYFDVAKDSSYGKLVTLDRSSLKANAKGRMQSDEYDKDNAQDFALWKAWTPDDGDIFWETALGKGRPGWHIECSAMAMSTLGETIDIHTGGVDNKFPHHENEIAQSECSTGRPFARYFMHNEWILVEGKKMAKSAGNFYTLRDLVDKGYNPIVFRHLLLTAHYRTPLNFTFEALDASETALERLILALIQLPNGGTPDENYRAKFTTIISEDFDTANAFALVADVLKDSELEGAVKKATVLEFDNVFGLGLSLLSEKIALPSLIEGLVEKRSRAKEEKDWELADSLRTQIEKAGYGINDGSDGTQTVFKRLRQQG